MPGFFGGFAAPFRGAGHLLRTRALWKYAALPFALNLVVYTAIAVALWWFVQDVVIAKWLASTWTWLRWVVAALAYAAGLVLMAFTFTVIGNLVASPLLDLLAERALGDLRGKPLPPGGPWWREAAASIGRQLVKLAVFGGLQLALLVLLLVPVVNLLHPPLAWLVTVVFLAMEYLEYPQAADRRPMGDRLAYIFRHGRACLGFGTALFLIVLVPLLGYAALPVCVVGATLLYDRIERVPPGGRPGESPLNEPPDRL